MQQLGLENEDDYVERLRGTTTRLVETELRNLLNLVTVTETCFFRDASQFRLLRESIIPTLIAERRHVRIWSAGCSSGEEAYSVAITLADMGLFTSSADLTFQIMGSDLNSQALESARRGIYSARAVRNVEGRILDHYFTRDGSEFALRDEIKQRVRFEFGNLNQTPMPSTGAQDVVFCKNVAIYFSNDLTRKLMRGLHDTIAPGGYLLLGHAEALWQMPDGFTLVEHDRAFCYRKKGNGHAIARAVDPWAAKPTPSVESVERYFSRAPAVRAFRPAPPPASGAGAADGLAQAVSPVESYDLCLADFHAGNWDAAESALKALVRSCPTFAPAHLLLGGLCANRSRFDEAIERAESVLALNALEPRAHLLLGMIAAREMRFDEALQSLRRALYLDDSLALAHFWLANIYRDRGDFARACQEFENVVRDWEERTLRLTEEFAIDLTVDQLVEYCRVSLKRLNQR
jgi:chemotaxis protein methyltransferase CheR